MFALPLAGPVSRSLALMMDFLVVMAITWAVSVLVVLWVSSRRNGRCHAGARLFHGPDAYSMALEWLWRGQTVGKRVMKLRVVDDRGLGLRPGQVVIRNLLRVVDSLPLFYLIGGMCMVFSRHCQRLGDLAAGTVVVRTQPVRSPRLEGLLAGQYNSFRQHPLLEARLRQKTSPEEAGLALSALLRRDALEPVHRLRVFGELAAHYREMAPFPPEATEGLTDEQYLRNVVETLFRKRGT